MYKRTKHVWIDILVNAVSMFTSSSYNTSSTSYNSSTTGNLDSEALYISKFSGKEQWLQLGYYIIPALGIPGNIITLIVLLSNHTLRIKPINLFILHQSVIDLIACIFTVIEEYLLENGINGDVLCHFFHSKYASGAALFTSSYNMTAMTLERHFAVTDPLHYDSNKVRRRLPFIFLSVWLFCYGALGYVPFSTVYASHVCIPTGKLFQTTFWDWMIPYVCFLAIGIPLVVMTVCYSRMFYSLYKSSRSLGSKADSGNVHKLNQAQLNIFQTCLIMIIIFLACWLTFESAMTMYIFKFYKDLAGIHYSIGNLLTLVNSGINPYIYVFRYDDFKKQLKTLLSI